MFEFFLILVIILVGVGLFKLYHLLNNYVNDACDVERDAARDGVFSDYIDKGIRQRDYDMKRKEREEKRDPLKGMY